MKLGAIALLSLVSAASVDAAQITAVLPLANHANIAARSAPARMLLNDDTPARAIELGALRAAETAKAAKSTTAVQRTHKPRPPLRVGIGRTVPASGAATRLADLSWRAAPAGGTAARLVLTSAGAAALRLGMRIADAPPGLELRFQGSGAPGETYGPVAASAMPSAYPYWSPTLSGERAVVEFALPEGVAPGLAMLQIPLISHLLADPSSPKVGCRNDPQCLQFIGTAGSCEMDVACVLNPSAALLSAESSVVRILFSNFEGDTILCSATLVNDSINSRKPYIYTANHCIDDFSAPDELLVASTQAAQEAASTNTYWFFQAATCGSIAVPNYVLLTGGAKLLARSFDYDWTLLQLNDAAPSGAAFSAWRAESMPKGTLVSALHHPSADLTKLSAGSVFDYLTLDDNGSTLDQDGSSWIETLWTQGVTEAGSSGSGLFTPSPDGSSLELRGGLFGGDSSCTRRSGLDQYSRLDNAIPLLNQYLTPNAPLADGAMPVVEFYNATLNDYVVTIDPGEINDLDTGVHAGWIRTGYRFLAYPAPATAALGTTANAATPPAGTSPVCRFYVLPAVGDSHFYSADPTECAETQAKFAGQWVYESPAVFYILLPDKLTGVCPVNSHAVYRFLNNANGLHHRYTAEVDQRDLINGLGTWTQEGYGNPPFQVVMCSPNG